MIFSILFVLIIFIFITSIIVGVVLLLASIKETRHSTVIRKVGLILAGLPTSIVAVVLIVLSLYDFISFKPTSTDLVGTYYVTKATNLGINSSDYDRYSLNINPDGTFKMSKVPHIDLCESGEYKVDYENSHNELSIYCPNLITSAHIDQGLFGFRLQFIIGDPDSGESIFFEKK